MLEGHRREIYRHCLERPRKYVQERHRRDNYMHCLDWPCKYVLEGHIRENFKHCLGWPCEYESNLGFGRLRQTDLLCEGYLEGGDILYIELCNACGDLALARLLSECSALGSDDLAPQSFCLVVFRTWVHTKHLPAIFSRFPFVILGLAP
jgi:hypothetical protein